MKILFITSRIPWPLEKGDKLRAYNQLKGLAAHHEIILCSLQDQPIPSDAEKELKTFCTQVHFLCFGKGTAFSNLLRGLLNGLPLQVAWFYHPTAARAIHALIKNEKPDCIYCQLIRTTEYVRDVASIPKVLDYMDAFSKGVERRLPKISPLLRPVYRMEYRRLLRYEKEIFDCFNQHTIISEQDRDLNPHPEHSKIHVVPNGIDTTFFRPQVTKKKYDILFNGNMGYPPNIESAEYLVHEIMPLVWKTHPRTTLLISGANPHPKVLRLRSENIVVSGWVDDVRDSFATSSMLVAPMQSSIGLQNKILEAMAMGVPCITSRLSSNATGAEHGRTILVADHPEEYKQLIVRLLDHPDEARRIADAAREFVQKAFNWEVVSKHIEQIIKNSVCDLRDFSEPSGTRARPKEYRRGYSGLR